LEKLGFPWILSSESRLINALHAKNQIIFLAAFTLAKERRTGYLWSWHGERTDCSWGKLSLISDFLQDIPALIALAVGGI
jgi:hypothetical protein